MSDIIPTLVARNGVAYYAALFLYGVVAGLAGLYGILSVQGAATIPAWALVFVCGLFFWRSLQPLLDARPRIIIDSTGIFDRNLAIGTIPWRNIVAVESFAVSGTGLIGLHLLNTGHWLQQSPARKRAVALANQKLGFPAFNVCLKGTRLKPDVVIEVIRQRIAAQGIARRLEHQPCSVQAQSSIG